MRRIRSYYLNNRHLRPLIWGVLLFLSTNLQAQQPTPLSEVLQSIERQHQVSFSFADELVLPIKVTPPNAQWNLQEKISYLQKQSGLSFQVINEKYIAIAAGAPRMLCGYILDNQTGVGIGFASIGMGKEATISDSTGYFQLEYSNIDTLKIIHLGYHSFSKVLEYSPECDPIYLTPKIQILPEVLIPNYLIEGIDKMINGQMQVTTQQMQILPGLIEPDVFYTLQSFPGISSFNESVSNINIRGGTNDQNLVLWDGIRMFQTGHFFGLISAFNPYIVDNVQITKNGTQAKYGEAVSGLLSLQSNSSIILKPFFSSGFNLLNADAVVQTPLSNKLSMQLSVRRSISDIFDSPTFESYAKRAFRDTEILSNDPDSVSFSNENFQYIDTNLKLNYQPSPSEKLEASIIFLDNQLEHEEAGRIDGNIESRTSTLEQQTMAYGLKFKKKLDTHWSGTISGSHSFYRLNSINFDILNEQRLHQQNEISDLNLKLDMVYKPNHLVKLETGYHLGEIAIGNLEELDNPGFRRYIKEVLMTHVFYGQGSLISSDGKTNASFGLRTNYYHQLSTFTLEPRIGLNRQLTEYLAIEFLGERKSQSIVQIIDLQNDFLGVEKRRWVVANEDDIPLLRSYQASIGFQYNKKGWMSTVDGFVKNVDGILTSSQAFQNQFELVRAQGSYLIKGLELLVNRKIASYSTWVSYSYSKNTYKFPPLNTPTFSSNLDIPHQLTFGVGYKNKNLQISTSINWHSGRPYTNPGDPTIVGGVINYLNPNAERQEAYLRVDLSAKYKIDTEKKWVGEVGIAFWNLTRHKNLVNTYFRNDGMNGAKRIENLALGFTPNIMARFKLKK